MKEKSYVFLVSNALADPFLRISQADTFKESWINLVKSSANEKTSLGYEVESHMLEFKVTQVMVIEHATSHSIGIKIDLLYDEIQSIDWEDV